MSSVDLERSGPLSIGQSPLAVRAILGNARLSMREGEAAAEGDMFRPAQETFTSEDDRKGIDDSFNERPGRRRPTTGDRMPPLLRLPALNHRS